MRVGRVVAAAVAVAAVAVSCSDGADRVRITTGDVQATPSFEQSASPPSAYVTPSPANPVELDIFGRVQAFASAPSQSAFEQVPFADEVALGLGDRVEQTVARAELAAPAAWVLDQKSYGGREGPFSALETLRSGSDAAVVSGPHNHCASPPRPALAGFDQMRRVSAQPTDIDSCIDWWAVDLFLNTDGRIAAVLLDIWDP